MTVEAREKHAVVSWLLTKDAAATAAATIAVQTATAQLLSASPERFASTGGSPGTKATIMKYLTAASGAQEERAADLIRGEQSRQPGSLLISTYKRHSCSPGRYTCSHLTCVNRSSEATKWTQDDVTGRKKQLFFRALWRHRNM